MKKYSLTTRVNSRRTSTKRWRLILLGTGVLVIGSLLLPRLFSGVAFIILYPVHAVSNWYEHGTQALPQYLRARSEIIAEIDSLKRQIASETGTELTIRRLTEENNELRAATKFSTTTNRLMAGVIAEPTSLSYDLLQIDKGSNQGIKEGAPVFVGVDTVIGVVAYVTPTYSFVELITTPGFSATAYVLGPNVFAPLEGMGGGVARVKLPQGIKLEVGNLVLLPSTDSGVYGEIVAIEDLPTQPEQFGYITPPVSLQSMLYVSVANEIPVPRTAVELDTAVRDKVREYFKFDSSTLEATLASSTSSTTTPSE